MQEKLTLFILFFVISAIISVCGQIISYRTPQLRVEPGPSVKATRGEVWPKPQWQVYTDQFLIVRPNVFEFKVVNQTCDILEKALQRYTASLKKHDKIRRSIKNLFGKNSKRRAILENKDNAGYLDSLSVALLNPCEELPMLDMDEQYELNINTPDLPQSALLSSSSIWGILRGLETWSQLLYTSDDGSALLVNGTSITDYPRFSHRGLLIDTSRHFLPVRIITEIIDAMEMNKFNVLHWHIVDHQSFPYQSAEFPDLTAKGAYTPAHIYTQDDVKKIVKYAQYRGIRVIPEFDSPGHTRSWGEGYPQLLTTCYENSSPDGTLGPINPISNYSYSFMEKFLTEAVTLFPDNYIHLGADEVEYEIACWDSNPEISEYLKTNNMTSQQLEAEYVRRIIEVTKNLYLQNIVWQELIDGGEELPLDTLVQVWKSKPEDSLSSITQKGYRVLLSSCWYLDHLTSGGDWTGFYDCDPYYFPGDDEQRKKVIGGEACMWAEVVDSNNVIPRIWPRASAIAEKLWSSGSATNKTEAAKRLEEHVCRMNRRGINAQPPNGPGFCPDANFA